ncbi:hypothetical protein [Rhizobium wenxiniae]|uniref:hypothetical protein n=1 Tax=Rhizobium wenxiniae TaxID=1737357 RepID=UPI003C227EBA
MGYGFNLHTVHRGMERGAPIVLDAGSVHKYSAEDFDDLLKVDAIRKPTETEMKLYFLANPNEAPDDGEVEVVEPKAKGGRAKKSAAADPEPSVADGDAPADSTDADLV